MAGPFNRKWLVIFLSGLLLLPALHIFDSYTIPPKVNKFTRDSELLVLNNELALEISRLIAGTRGYILYSDEDSLREIHALSNSTVKKELNLYNKSGPETKKDLEELMEVSQNYISLVETKIIPAVQARDKKQLQGLGKQSRILGAELQKRAEGILLMRKEKLRRDSHALQSLEKKKRTLSLLLMLSSLLLLSTFTRRFLLPLSAQYSRLKEMTRRLRSAVLVTDRRGYIKNINRAAEKMFSFSAGQVKGIPVNEVINLFPFTQNIIQPLLNVILEEKEIANYQTFYTRGEDKTLLNVDYIPLFLNEKMTGTALIARPVEIHPDKGFLFEAIEAERKKISIEIHDWIGRNMSPIIHSLDYVLNIGAKNLPENVHRQLVQLRQHCQSAANDMRSIMNDIHPYLIDKVGLISALESHVRHFEEATGTKVYLFYQNMPLELEKNAEIVIYRIVQEALANVTKHSNADEVDIYFQLEDETLQIEITDNGDSFRETGNGKGLWGMKERANLIGGDLVYGFAEGGFTVTLTVPVAKEEGYEEGTD